MDTKILYSKLATVPPTIKAWLGSDAVIEDIDRMDDQFTIPKGSGAVISKLIQRLQIKDIATEYFSGELASALNLEKDKAIHITDEIKKTILIPIKKDLSDYGIDISGLDKFQMPPITNPATVGPNIIPDVNAVKPAILTPKPNPVSISQATSQTTSGAPNIKSVAIPNANIPPAAPKTDKLSDVGWSRSRTADPVIKLDTTPAPTSASVPTPKPAQTTPPKTQTSGVTPPTPAAPAGRAVSEFDRLSAMKKGPSTPSAAVAPTAPSAPTTPAAPTQPAPFILHQDASVSSAPKNVAFKIAQPQASSDVRLDPSKNQSAVRPAVLEFGQNANKPSASVSSSSSSVVHYTQFKPSLSTAPTQNSGSRQINQIVPPPAPAPSVPAPTPPRPPQPPTMSSSAPRVPMPPMPPTAKTPPASQEKVIVKDFL